MTLSTWVSNAIVVLPALVRAAIWLVRVVPRDRFWRENASSCGAGVGWRSS